MEEQRARNIRRCALQPVCHWGRITRPVGLWETNRRGGLSNREDVTLPHNGEYFTHLPVLEWQVACLRLYVPNTEGYNVGWYRWSICIQLPVNNPQCKKTKQLWCQIEKRFKQDQESDNLFNVICFTLTSVAVCSCRPILQWRAHKAGLFHKERVWPCWVWRIKPHCGTPTDSKKRKWRESSILQSRVGVKTCLFF